MKCLLFIFTVCSIGKFFVQGHHESDQNSDYQEEVDEDESNQYVGSSTEVKSYDYSDETQPQHEESSRSSASFSEESQERQREPPPKSNYLNAVNSQEHPSIQREKAKKLFAIEMAAGDQADLIGQNEHTRQNDMYEDLGRRSVPQGVKNIAEVNDNYLIPEKAPPELVLLVAKESALLGPGKDADLASDIDQKKILRSGDYWNGVWKEEVNPKSVMRSGTAKKNLGSIKAKIKRGTELYKVVSQMKEISPKLLYIINKN